MANDHILVSTQAMQEAIQKYENARQTLQEAYSQLDSAKEHLDRCYAGPAKAVLLVRYADICMNVRTADNAIDESVNGLRNTINEMEDTEETITGQYQNLETGRGAPTYL